MQVYNSQSYSYSNEIIIEDNFSPYYSCFRKVIGEKTVVKYNSETTGIFEHSFAVTVLKFHRLTITTWFINVNFKFLLEIRKISFS